LDSKFQVNSLQDVFFHPFYWQIYLWLNAPPQLVVDLGAHCGHFSMLADLCFRTRFGDVRPEYVLVEPNPRLVPVIKSNLTRSGLCPCHRIHQGLVGARSGSGTLWISSHNYLSAGLERAAGTRGVPVKFIDLEDSLNGRPVDLLKMDIEGAEYEFVANYPTLMRTVHKLMIEIHAASAVRRKNLHAALHEAGLRPQGEILEHSGYQLAMFQREQP
jgi:FkbM family methyltransferase